MSEPLVTYLKDHLGGAQIAIQLLEAMRDQHDNQRFREFASLLLSEIEADDRTLRSIAEKMDAGPGVADESQSAAGRPQPCPFPSPKQPRRPPLLTSQTRIPIQPVNWDRLAT
jgi:hypothetical protein